MTDAQLKAEILSYSRAQGLFAGINLTGGVLAPDKDNNRDLYGREVSPKDILVGKTVTAPAAAQRFMAALRRTIPRGQSGRIVTSPQGGRAPWPAIRRSGLIPPESGCPNATAIELHRQPVGWARLIANRRWTGTRSSRSSVARCSRRPCLTSVNGRRRWAAALAARPWLAAFHSGSRRLFAALAASPPRRLQLDDAIDQASSDSFPRDAPAQKPHTSLGITRNPVAPPRSRCPGCRGSSA